MFFLFFSVDSKRFTHWTPLWTLCVTCLSDWKEHDDFIFLIFILPRDNCSRSINDQPIMSFLPVNTVNVLLLLCLIQTSLSSSADVTSLNITFDFFHMSLQYSFLLSTTNVKTETKANILLTAVAMAAVSQCCNCWFVRTLKSAVRCFFYIHGTKKGR